MQQKKILILNFGSQLTQLIARKIREMGVYSEIKPFSYSVENIRKDLDVGGIILSGGPASVYDQGSPDIDTNLFDLGIPILGICYGMQLIAKKFGGEVVFSSKKEYGKADLKIVNDQNIFKSLDRKEVMWMSHGDEVGRIPEGFERLAFTENCDIAAFANTYKKVYGIQFHPEVHHSPRGDKVIGNFLFNVCNLKPTWKLDNLIKQEIEKARQMVGQKKVICALSGGVDSAVTALILQQAIGDQLECVFVDHGLLRLGEREAVEQAFKKNFRINLRVIRAEEVFFNNLKGVTDPERKRKIIGKTFIEVFEQESKNIQNVAFLAQGTLYPDVIESISSVGGQTEVIKSHHNVGGLPERLNFQLIEPLKKLFKDEVRQIGKLLGLSPDILSRHPFPGPGLAIRIIGEVTKDKVKTLQQADNIFIEELKNTKVAIDKSKIDKSQPTAQSWYDISWQAFAVLTSIKTVGVMGDGRTYENVLALRSVDAVDGMTADWTRLPFDLLDKVGRRIANEVRGINRVVYDISSKPPSTIEWE